MNRICSFPSHLCCSFKRNAKETEEEEVRNTLLEDSQDDQVKLGEEVSSPLPQEDFEDDKWKQGEEVTTLPEDFPDGEAKQGEEVSMTLPEDLVGSILAMVPFPFVFKARALSKSWLARFSSISSGDDEEKKRLATIFQKQVSERSTTWKTFCPVFLGKENLMTYDRTSCTWRKMQSLYVLPKNPITRFKRAIVQIEGALLFVSAWLVSVSFSEMQEYGVYFNLTSTLRGKSGEHELYVANVLTRSWRQLPPVPHPEGHFLYEKPSYLDAKLVSDTASGTYKVVVFYILVGHFLVQIYNSSLGFWKSKKLHILEDFEFLSHYAYLNGVFYRMVRNNNMSWGLLAFNVEDSTFEVLPMLPVDIPIQFGLVDLVVCNESLMMIAYNNFYTVERLIVLKIDVDSRRCVEMTRGPPATFNFGNLQKHPASDGDCIFFASANFGGMLAYNVREDVWSCFPCPTSVVRSHFSHIDSTREYEWTSSSFQPGLNPFMAV